jgi:hypothetical protein
MFFLGHCSPKESESNLEADDDCPPSKPMGLLEDIVVLGTKDRLSQGDDWEEQHLNDKATIRTACDLEMSMRPEPIYNIPTQIVFIDSIVRNPTGKNPTSPIAQSPS